MNIKERKAHNTTTQKRRSRRKNKRSSGKRKMDGWKRKKQAQYNDYAGEWGRKPDRKEMPIIAKKCSLIFISTQY